MAKYIKQEMIDLSGQGEEKVYYRLKTERNIGFKELAEYVGRHNNVMNRGLVENVMAHVVDAMAELMGNGYSVTIDGLGTFKASLGLEKDKEMDTLDGDEAKRNARSLHLTGINYRADKGLIKQANRHCKLERAGEARLHHSPYSKEERLKLALHRAKSEISGFAATCPSVNCIFKTAPERTRESCIPPAHSRSSEPPPQF